MLWSERRLTYGDGALVERLGLGIAALGLIQLGQVVEASRDFGMLRPERLLPDR